MMKHGRVACISLLAGLTFISLETRAETTLSSSITPAQPLERPSPLYPITERKAGGEGWVRLSYVIDTQGKVVNPKVLTSSGSTRFERHAISAVKQWRFSPARNQAGDPVVECANKVQLDFVLDNNHVARRQFASLFKQTLTFIEQQAYGKAEDIFAEIEKLEFGNRYETIWQARLEQRLAEANGEHGRELKAIESALCCSESKTILDQQIVAYLLKRQFGLYAQQQSYANALSVYRRLKEHDIDRTALAPYATKIRQIIKSDSPIVIDGRLQQAENWSHKLVRQRFSIAALQGELDQVELRCNNLRNRYDFESWGEWSVPAQFENCRVFISGSPESRFQLVELNTEQTASTGK